MTATNKLSIWVDGTEEEVGGYIRSYTGASTDYQRVLTTSTRYHQQVLRESTETLTAVTHEKYRTGIRSKYPRGIPGTNYSEHSRKVPGTNEQQVLTRTTARALPARTPGKYWVLTAGTYEKYRALTTAGTHEKRAEEDE